MHKAWWSVVLFWAAACADGSANSAVMVAGQTGTPGAGASGVPLGQAGANAQAGTSPRAMTGAAGVAAVTPASAAGRGGMNAANGAGVAGNPGMAGPGGTAGLAGAPGIAGMSGSAGPSAGVSGSSSGLGGAGAAGNGSAMAPAPSAGCMKSTGRPQGGVVMQADRIYTFPASYDGKTPLPFVLALHAAGNPNTQLQNLTKGSKLESDFVRVFPKSAGNAWVYKTDIAKIDAVMDEVLATYCIDTNRLFATGHSSGAQMVVQMLCNGEDRFKAVAPVAASKYCAKVSPVAVLYIQGMMDAQRGGGNGKDVVDTFVASNMCKGASTPRTDVASCTSSFDHKEVTPGCVTYNDCSVPTLWCSHNDNGYNNTDGRQHGWPCFASSTIADFFLGF